MNRTPDYAIRSKTHAERCAKVVYACALRLSMRLAAAQGYRTLTKREESDLTDANRTQHQLSSRLVSMGVDLDALDKAIFAEGR